MFNIKDKSTLNNKLEDEMRVEISEKLSIGIIIPKADKFSMCPYWEDSRKELEELEKVDTFNQIGEIGVEVLKKIPKSLTIIQPCGKIAGKNQEINEAVFKACIAEQRRMGLTPFDHSYTWPAINRLKRKWDLKNGTKKYCHPILFDTYRKFFESGLIDIASFLPNYKYSRGAKWEYINFTEIFNIEIEYFPPNVFKEVLKKLGIPNFNFNV